MVAGFFDGEGALIINKTTSQPWIRLNQAFDKNKDLTVFKKIKRYFPKSKLKIDGYAHKKNKKHKIQISLDIYAKRELINFLGKIIPYMKIRQCEAKKFLNYVRKNNYRKK